MTKFSKTEIRSKGIGVKSEQEMSAALLQWRRRIQRPKQEWAENACQIVVLQSGNLGQQHTEYYVPPNLVPTERLSTAMANPRNCLRRIV